MKVSEAHITSLYVFVRKHFVEYYDLQTELVDHLANGIEAQWEVNPEISFEDALSFEFKKFGVFGFSEIVEIRTQTLQKRYIKEVWRCLTAYFRLPKIIITVLSIYITFKLLSFFENKDAIIVSLTLLGFGYIFYHIIKLHKQIKNRQRLTGKKWLFEQINASFGGLVQIFNIGIYLPLFSNFDKNWNSISLLVFSACLVMYVLMFYVSIKVVSPKLRVKFSKDYPEYINLKL